MGYQTEGGPDLNQEQSMITSATEFYLKFPINHSGKREFQGWGVFIINWVL
jgi:hypothetical protein